MSTFYADIQVVNAMNTIFTNAAPGDLVVYAENSNQSIHFGNTMGDRSSLKLTSSNVELKGDFYLTQQFDFRGLKIGPRTSNSLGIGNATTEISKVRGYSAEGTAVELALNGAQTGFTFVDAVRTQQMTVTSNGMVGIGTSNPQARIHVDDLGVAPVSLRLDKHANNAVGPVVEFYKSRGTNAAPLAVSQHDVLASTGCYAHDGSTYRLISEVATQAESNATLSNVGGRLALRTRNVGSSSVLQERMTLKGDGSVGVGTSNPIAALHVSSSTIYTPNNSVNNTLLMLESHVSFPDMRFRSNNNSGNTTLVPFAVGQHLGQITFEGPNTNSVYNGVGARITCRATNVTSERVGSQLEIGTSSGGGTRNDILLSQDGFVSLGNTGMPATLLHIQSTSNYQVGTPAAHTLMMVESHAGGPEIRVRANNNNGSTNLVPFPINTQIGGISFEAPNNNSLYNGVSGRLTCRSTGNSTVRVAAQMEIGVSAGTTTITGVCVASSGKVGILHTAPETALDVEGKVRGDLFYTINAKYTVAANKTCGATFTNNFDAQIGPSATNIVTGRTTRLAQGCSYIVTVNVVESTADYASSIGLLMASYGGDYMTYVSLLTRGPASFIFFGTNQAFNVYTTTSVSSPVTVDVTMVRMSVGP